MIKVIDKIIHRQDHHNSDYIALLAILALAAITVSVFELTQSSLMLATTILSVGYVAWGVLHHKKHGHIDKKIMLEYLGLAVLVNVIIFTLIR